MPRLTSYYTCLNDQKPLCASGRDGVIYRISDRVVLKTPFDWTNPSEDLLEAHRESIQNIEHEKRIYDLLDPYTHPNFLLRPLSNTGGIFLQYATGGNLEERLRSTDTNPAHLHEKLVWITGIITAELFLAQLGYMHGDLKPENILLHHGVVKLCDFSSTVPIGQDLIAPRFPRYSKPVDSDDVNMIADEVSEIFAIGTCIYFILMEHEPYPILSHSDVIVRFKSFDFPPTDGKPFHSFGNIGEIIQHCWHGRYTTVQDLHNDVILACKNLGLDRHTEQDVGSDGDLFRDLQGDCDIFLQNAMS